jgi:hypothetical protein
MLFWVVTPSGLVGSYQRFGETYFLHLQAYSKPVPIHILREMITINDPNLFRCSAACTRIMSFLWLVITWIEIEWWVTLYTSATGSSHQDRLQMFTYRFLVFQLSLNGEQSIVVDSCNIFLNSQRLSLRNEVVLVTDKWKSLYMLYLYETSGSILSTDPSTRQHYWKNSSLLNLFHSHRASGTRRPCNERAASHWLCRSATFSAHCRFIFTNSHFFAHNCLQQENQRLQQRLNQSPQLHILRPPITLAPY